MNRYEVCFKLQVAEEACNTSTSVKAVVRYYNENRIRLKLKGLSPVQYREQAALAA
ncbi:IS3 family transposase [Stenotrophomonas sp. YAU14A_MKIMI4_1]|uniref:IS3 family transposase n=1 Tax=Stenotrophomonas sp. YAU14A_MKIMI4_1 TaxID=2072408 RepID=UPI0019007B80|nr:IS3 family transposase [Stenotrophomonas sp. YAU14A_MKIMI4_1]